MADRDRFTLYKTRIAALQLTAKLPQLLIDSLGIGVNGAGDGIRTRDIDLGKVALYQLSYSRLAGLKDILV